MRGAPPRRLMAEINVVPYIDVMLVLLIIFMVTVPLIQQGVEIDLPKAEAAPLPEDDAEPLILTVQRNGQIFLNKGGVTDRALNEEALAAQLRLLLPAERGRAYVRGDRLAQYGDIVEAMVVLQDAGAEKVGLITEPPADAPAAPPEGP